MSVKRDNRGNLILSDEIKLKELITVTKEEFPEISLEELFFDRLLYRGPENVLLLGIDRPLADDFVKHSDSSECNLVPHFSLADAIRRAESLPKCNFDKVRIFWFQGQLIMDIKK